uniref:ATPase AAA-type core domain-containing protein n=1 Tax=Musa acuminata subsp. malaccensis TaxID=214687 RepID=A0A804HNB9_MUSAM
MNKNLNFLQPRGETPEGSYTIWGAKRQHFIDLYSCGKLNFSNFLAFFGSELIQKYLGDGPKLVRELFRVADELSPSIVFIDEIEAVKDGCIGISPVYRAIFQPFSHIISKR